VTAQGVAAVILSYNSLASLRFVLAGVKAQTHRANAIIVVDNASTDGTQAYLSAHEPDVKLIALEKNVGVGAGHNEGWRCAMFMPAIDYIWSLEHDSWPEPDCLAQLLACYADRDDRATLGALCPWQETGYDDLGLKGVYYWKRRRFARIDGTRPDAPYVARSLTFNGTLIPRQIVVEVGLLNETFYIGQEDFDYAERIKQTGRKLLLTPAAVVRHDVFRTMRRISLGGRILLLPDQSVMREYYQTRNNIARQVAEQGNRRALVKLLAGLPGSVAYTLMMKDRKLARLQVRYLAIRDGLTGRMGPRHYRALTR
jgi:GT2 family glycosyltransferase